MKKFLIILIVLIVAVFAVWKFVFHKDKKPSGPKPVGMYVSKHSDEFNQSIMKAMDAYYALTESFVNWDTARVTSTLAEFKTTVDSIRITDLEKDSIYLTAQTFWESISTEIVGMQIDTSLYEKRESLNMLSQQLYDLLRTVKYDAAKVYYQECPMALNNYETSGFWLSNEAADEKRRNPYLGLHDPKYSKGMLKCGSTRDSIRTN